MPKKYLSLLLLGVVVLTPMVAAAALLDNVSCPSTFVNCTVGSGRQGVISLTLYIINLLLAIAGIIAVLFVIIGGFQYIFSGANEELAERGKKTLTNAVIGVVIIILSFVIIRVVSNLLT